MIANPVGPTVAAAEKLISMDRQMYVRSLHLRSGSEPRTARGFILLVAATVVLLASFAPRSLFLPIVSLVAIAVAGLAALLGWARGTQWGGDTITAWDVAGAFAFIGCAAAMLSEPENVLQLLGDHSVP